jgi:hypothetical protein
MKLHELLTEDKKQVDEAPASIIGQGLRRMGSAALSAIGAKHTAGNLAGKADVGKRANIYAQEFGRYLGRNGKSLRTADYADLNDFFVQNKLSAGEITKTGPVRTAEVDKLLKIAAQNYLNGKSDTTKATPSTAEPKQVNTQTSKTSDMSSNVATAKAQTTYQMVKSNIDKLDKKGKERIMAYLQKSLGTANQPASRTKPPGKVSAAKPPENINVKIANSRRRPVAKVAV